jgi:hypothetical protein
MRKLKLEMDELRVETFEAGFAGGRGTVAGRGGTSDDFHPCEPVEPEDSINYCGPPPTSPATCGWTACYTCSCGCTRTQAGWTCDPYASECTIPPDQG